MVGRGWLCTVTEQGRNEGCMGGDVGQAEFAHLALRLCVRPDCWPCSPAPRRQQTVQHVHRCGGRGGPCFGVRRAPWCVLTSPLDVPYGWDVQAGRGGLRTLKEQTFPTCILSGASHLVSIACNGVDISWLGPPGQQAPQRERVSRAAVPGNRDVPSGRRRGGRHWKSLLRPDVNMGVPQLMMILEPNVVWEHTQVRARELQPVQAQRLGWEAARYVSRKGCRAWPRTSKDAKYPAVRVPVAGG